MIGCLRTRVRKHPIIALYFVFGNELKFYNLEAWFCAVLPGVLSSCAIILLRKSCFTLCSVPLHHGARGWSVIEAFPGHTVNH